MERSMFMALLALLAWAPWPLGSNRPWSWSVLAAIALALVAAWCLRAAVRNEPLRLPEGASTALLVGVAAVAWCLAQTLPVPVTLAATLSAAGTSHQALAPGAGGTVSISLDVGATLLATLKLATYLAVFFLVLVLVTSRRRLAALLGVLVAVAAAQVFYGVLARYGGVHVSLWDPGFDPLSLSGTYVNRNHLAGLLVLALGISAGAALSMFREHGGGHGLRALVDQLTRIALGRGLWMLFVLVVLTGGLALTTSRGGILAVSCGIVLGALVSGHGRRLPRLVLGGALVAMLATLWLGTGELLPRLAEKGIESDRPELMARTLDLVSHSPWVGGGAGTFGARFSEVRGATLQNAFFHHAHNDYLELLADLGVIGCVPFVIGCVVLVRRLLGGLRERRDTLARMALTGCAMALGGAGVHALVGFNFHIPANAAWFFALAAVALVAADRDRLRHHDGRGHGPVRAGGSTRSSSIPFGELP